MADFIVSPIVELLKCFFPSIKVGVGYLVQHKKKIGELKTKLQTLRTLKSDVQHKVEVAERNLETIFDEAVEWLGK
ncbi:hypothetical protein MKW92_022056, partial [Papaver armeniacum]